MSDVYIISGRRHNQIPRGVSPATATTRSGYDVADAYDGDPVRFLLLASGFQTNRFIKNLNQIPNGDFEQPFVNNLPVGWKCFGSSPAVRWTADKIEGDASLKIGQANKSVFVDLPVSAGEVLNAYIQIRAFGTAYAQNLQSGKWLQPDGSWGSTRLGWHGGGASWSPKLLTFTVEDFETCGEEPTIRWILEGTPAITPGGLFDMFVVFPRIDIVVFIGHNITPASLPQLEATFADPMVEGAAEKVTLTEHARHTLFCAMDPMDFMKWEIQFPPRLDGQSTYVGEIILGQRTRVLRRYDAGISVKTLLPQDRSEPGALQSFIRAVHPRRSVSVSYFYFQDEDFQQMFNELERSRNGCDPIVFIHDSDDPGSAIYGRVDPTVEWTHVSDQAENRRMPSTVVEMPLPNLYPDDPDDV